MASRSSSSTGSRGTVMTKPSERSRAELPQGDRRAQASQGTGESTQRSPKDKKHKDLQEVRSTGRQSDQGGSPGRRTRNR
jgi:hypothetical protein